jgi:predicted nucleotidyltransferase
MNWEPHLRIAIPEPEVEAVCRSWQVRELAIFGSALRPDFSPRSDIDLLVSFEASAPWSLLDIVKMKARLEEIFGRPVDLVERKALRNPFRRSEILKTAQVIYAA